MRYTTCHGLPMAGFSLVTVRRQRQSGSCRGDYDPYREAETEGLQHGFAPLHRLFCFSMSLWGAATRCTAAAAGGTEGKLHAESVLHDTDEINRFPVTLTRQRVVESPRPYRVNSHKLLQKPQADNIRPYTVSYTSVAVFSRTNKISPAVYFLQLPCKSQFV